VAIPSRFLNAARVPTGGDRARGVLNRLKSDGNQEISGECHRGTGFNPGIHDRNRWHYPARGDQFCQVWTTGGKQGAVPV